MFQRKLGGLVAVAAIVAACGPGGTASTAPTTGPATAAPGTAAPASEGPPPTQAAIGEGEGSLNLVIWAGYAERGDVDRLRCSRRRRGTAALSNTTA